MVPAGPEDPEFALIAVKIEHAEYWKVESNKMVQLGKHGEILLA